MSTVIRDVVIRVGVQNGQSDVSVAPLQQATTAAQTLQTQTTAASEAAANMWTNLRGPTAAEAAAQFETAAKSINEVAEAKKNLSEQGKQDEQQKENAAKLAKAQTELTTAYLQVGEAAKQTMSGAMGLARSYAYLTAASEENLQSAMRTIATVEGVAHSISGTIDLITGITKAYRGWAIASTAAAAANALVAKSQGSIGANAVGGVAAGAVSTGVGGVVSGGIGGVLAGVMTAAKTALSGLITVSAAVAAKFVSLVAVLSLVGTEIIDRLTGGGGFLSILDEWAKERASDKKTASMASRSASRNEMAMSAETRFAENASLQAQIRDTQLSTASSVAMVGAQTPEQQIQAINKQREIARNELAQAQAAIAQAEQNAAQRRAAGQAPLMAEMTAATERQKTASEQMVQIEERRLAALRSGQDALKAQRDQQVAALQTAQQALQMEQDKNKSLAVRFAQLSEIERTQLKTINEKMQKGGQLGEADVAFLEQKGFGQQATEKFRVAQAQQQGFGSLVTDLGGGGAERERVLTDQVKARQKQIDQTISRVFESVGEIEQAEAAMVKAFEDRDAAIINTLKAASEAAMKLKERFDRSQQASRN